MSIKLERKVKCRVYVTAGVNVLRGLKKRAKLSNFLHSSQSSSSQFIHISRSVSQLTNTSRRLGTVQGGRFGDEMKFPSFLGVWRGRRGRRKPGRDLNNSVARPPTTSSAPGRVPLSPFRIPCFFLPAPAGTLTRGTGIQIRNPSFSIPRIFLVRATEHVLSMGERKYQIRFSRRRVQEPNPRHPILSLPSPTTPGLYDSVLLLLVEL